MIKLKVTVGSESLYQHYEYDQRGLLTDVYVSTGGSYDPQTDGPEVTYTYTPTGAVDKIVYKGGKEADYKYTVRDWVKSINSVGSPGKNFAAEYNYTDNGNISKAQFYNPDIALGSSHTHYHWNFGYDHLNRLLSADYGPGSGGSSPSFDVTGLDYDAAGNIKTLQRKDDSGGLIDDLSYSYSGSNRLQSVSDAAGQPYDWDAASATFGYDANGNLTSQSGKIDNIVYDHRNLPTYFNLSNGSEMQAAYNADGQRILKESSGGAWSFYVTDGQQTLAVIDQSGFSHFNLVGNGTFGRYTDSGARRYYVTDHLGSTRAVVDSNGTVLETFDYYPFGLLMPKRNTASANTTEKFSGKELDESTNQYYFGARYYDPALGRFFVTDRFADKYPEMTPYQYAANSPMNFIDVNGDSVDVNHLSEDDQNALVGQLQKLTGLSLSVNEGMLLFDEDAEINTEGMSKTALKDLMHSIGHKEVVQVKSRPEGSIRGSSFDDETNTIFLNMEDIRFAEENSVGVSPLTNGLGMTFLHELNHSPIVPSGGTRDDGFVGIGRTVLHINKMRNEINAFYRDKNNGVPIMGWRTSYGHLEDKRGLYIPFSVDGYQRVYSRER